MSWGCCEISENSGEDSGSFEVTAAPEYFNMTS